MVVAACGASLLKLAATTAAQAADAGGDAVHGKIVFQTCAARHSDKPDAIGPTLRGVYDADRARSMTFATRTP